MMEFTVEREFVLKQDFYCSECGTWIYCPDMNHIEKTDQGVEIKKIGDGCVMEDNTGEFMKCPGCARHFYLKP